MEGYNNLRDRALRAIAGRPLDKIVTHTRAIVGPRLQNLEGDAHDGLEAFKNGRRPTAQQVAALQAVVRAMRPSVLSRQGMIDALPLEANPVFPDWTAFTAAILSHLYTIGRVDRKATGPKAPDPFGTGFLLTPELFLTNHHVVTKITDGTDIIDPGTVEVRFVQESGAPDEPAIPVLEIYGFHPDEDAAILRLARSALLDSRKPLSLSTLPLADGANVVVVGYPSADSRNPLFVDTIFGGKLSVKRLAPGEFIGTKRGALFHDCSTLGGNSGSPLVDMTTGTVVGLHRDGSFLARNEAVGIEALRDFVKVT
jgi:S1-C subfamily serine protease